MNPPPDYRIWTDHASTVFVRLWSNGEMEVATRDDRNHIWGPPIRVVEGQP